ncbi:MAG: hypothetical protein U1E19_10890 [Rhodoblastus sp.]
MADVEPAGVWREDGIEHARIVLVDDDELEAPERLARERVQQSAELFRAADRAAEQREAQRRRFVQIRSRVGLVRRPRRSDFLAVLPA